MNLEPFKELIRRRCGLTFEGVAEKPLREGLCRRMELAGEGDAHAYLDRLGRDDHEFHELVSLLAINETYFYREPEQLHWLVDRLVPKLLAQKKDAGPLRILSAGCSSGEEPYSIAMALREKYGESAARLFVLIAGDIDKAALDEARAARYGKFSFRGLAPELRARYFTGDGKSAWALKDEIRDLVHFRHLNLLAEHYPDELRDFDVIFFRNVSIYFDEPVRRLIQQRLAVLLREDGVLVAGLAETLANDLGVLHLVEQDGLFHFSRQPVTAGTVRATRPPQLRKPVVAPETPRTLAAGKPHAPSLVAPQVPEPRSAVDDIDAALELIRKKKYPDAMVALGTLLLGDSDNVAAKLLKAYVLLQRKDYAAVEVTAREVLSHETWSADAAMLLGLAAKWRDMPDEAVKWFKQAVYACHGCWPAHFYLGELHRAANRIEPARRAYRLVLQLLAAASPEGNGLVVIPLELPASEVRFMCEHHLARLNSAQAA